MLMGQRKRILTNVACMVLPFCFLTFLPSNISAQTFTRRLQESGNGQGKITIHQDAQIDELVNGPTITPQRQQRQDSRNTSQQDNRNAQQQANRSNTTHQSQQQQEQSSSQHSTEQVSDTTVQQAPRRTRKIVGYRIQAFVGGKTRADRQKAEQTGNALRALFPGHTVYVHFYSPRWICRIGNYRTYEEAKEMLAQVVSAGYSSATIVKGRITVPY